MDTYKPISTIGYNTEKFLLERLNELKFTFTDLEWCYIYHTDEVNKKDHYHLYLEPNTRLRQDDLSRIRESFKEYQEGDELPLGVMPWRKSDFENWYLYALHDRPYLSAKHLVKSTYDYDPDLVRKSSSEYFQDSIDQIDPVKYMSPVDKVIFCFDNGMSLTEAMAYLRIPYSAFYGFMKTWRDCIQFKEKAPSMRNLLEEPPLPSDEDAPGSRRLGTAAGSSWRR